MGQGLIKYDFSGIEGSNCYCADEAAEQIRGLLRSIDPDTPLWMGSGDYHYISLFRAECLLRASGGPSTIELIYFDNHPDDQDDAFGGDLLSCGNWVKCYRALGPIRTTWHNGNGEVIVSGTGAPTESPGNPPSPTSADGPISAHSPAPADGADASRSSLGSLPPVHLSIDLDVLSREYAHTNWDQGSMTLDELCRRVSAIAASRRIACIDFCGGLTESKGGTPEDDALNTLAVETILLAL
ncbi:MAG: hypothetical protein KBS67_01080 [Bacteroidales bacterium]|nr:hypothetical protein [Candidatus Cryptobacteroides equifaecalis]